MWKPQWLNYSHISYLYLILTFNTTYAVSRMYLMKFPSQVCGLFLSQKESSVYLCGCLFVSVLISTGTDEQALINIIVQRSNAQRVEIRLRYKTMFGKVSNLRITFVIVEDIYLIRRFVVWYR